MDRKIYKFSPLNKFSRDILMTGKFYFADWGNIYDCINCNAICYHNLNELLNRFDIGVSGVLV